MGIKMSANDNFEKILRELHVILSKSEPYKKEPTKVIVDKQQMLDLLSDLNKCTYDIMDEYEMTARSRDKAEREFKKKGDQIIWDASRKAEDIYAASIMYMEEALNGVWDVIHNTNDKMFNLYNEINDKVKSQEKEIKSNQLELKSQLQNLVDTEKYLKLIEERNREIQKQKQAGKEKTSYVKEKSIYANRQTEIKVNTEYLEKLGLLPEEDGISEKNSSNDYENSQSGNDSASNSSLNNKEDEKMKTSSDYNDANGTLTEKELKEREAKMRADLDADYFNWRDGNTDENTNNKESLDLAEGIQKVWKSIKGSVK